MRESEYARLIIDKERLKFSAAHVTIFPDGSKERLHGHDYRVSLSVFLGELGYRQTLDFSLFKKLLEPLCARWDERVLVAGANPHVAVSAEGPETRVTMCGKRYVFPTDEVEVLPIENVTAELLAARLAELLVERLREEGHWKGAGPITGVRLEVRESPGQGAAVTVWREA